MVVTGEEPPRKPPARPSRVGPSLSERRGDRGQATVEFAALLPIIALVALALGQAAVAGWTAWSAAGAARVSARADAVGQDPEEAAQRVLPAMLARRARVSFGRAGGATEHRATVRLRVPAVVPGLRLGTVSASSEVPNQGDGA
ncbi:MAG: pilus assembly protein [Patulibacter minatonensis]